MDITSRYQFESWLEDKPADWAHVIAVRAALRVLPYAFEKRIDQKWVKEFAPPLIRSLAISWIVGNFPAHNMAVAAYAAADAYDAAAAAAAARAATHAAAAAAAYATSAVRAAAAAATYVATAPGAARAAVDAVAYAAAYGAVWFNISDDCHWLENAYGPNAARHLTCVKLWPAVEPKDWAAVWDHASTHLRNLDQGYGVWIDWYNRRIRGADAAFDIPGDSDGTEDKAILARLADATDEDFWDKGATCVNTTLQGWIDEARARVRPPAKADPLTDLLPDPQDGRSPVFGTDASGRIAISAHAGADILRTDPQAQARHALARRVAQSLGDGLRGHNNAGYITGMAEAYVEAMGDRVEAADPSILIFAGDQLREAIAKHRSAGPDDDLQPLPSAADRDASGFISAHNMYAGSDPYLDDLDRTTRGPDAPLPAADPGEIRAITERSFRDGILAETSHDYIVAAVAVAPAIYNPGDRHSRFASGLAQNFGRYGVELLAAYPDEAAWVTAAAGVGALVVLGPAAASAGTVSGIAAAYYMARNIIANEGIYRKLLGTSPAGEHNFNRIIRFLKSLPIKSLKDD